MLSKPKYETKLEYLKKEINKFPVVGGHKTKDHLNEYHIASDETLIHKSEDYFGDKVPNRLNLMGVCFDRREMEPEWGKGKDFKRGLEIGLKDKDKLIAITSELINLVQSGEAELEKSTLEYLNSNLLETILKKSDFDWRDENKFRELSKYLVNLRHKYYEYVNGWARNHNLMKEEMLLMQLKRKYPLSPKKIRTKQKK